MRGLSVVSDCQGSIFYQNDAPVADQNQENGYNPIFQSFERKWQLAEETVDFTDEIGRFPVYAANCAFINNGCTLCMEFIDDNGVRYSSCYFVMHDVHNDEMPYNYNQLWRGCWVSCYVRDDYYFYLTV